MRLLVLSGDFEGGGTMVFFSIQNTNTPALCTELLVKAVSALRFGASLWDLVVFVTLLHLWGWPRDALGASLPLEAQGFASSWMLPASDCFSPCP